MQYVTSKGSFDALIDFWMEAIPEFVVNYEYPTEYPLYVELHNNLSGSHSLVYHYEQECPWCGHKDFRI